MANPNDASGAAAERILLNARLVSLSSSVTTWTGDDAGRNDLALKIADTNYRLSALTTLGYLSTAPTGVGTAFAGFGIGGVAT